MERSFRRTGTLIKINKKRKCRPFCINKGNARMTNEIDTQSDEKVPTVEVTVEYLRKLHTAVGLQIDPETAEVDWIYGDGADPYGDQPYLPEENPCVGRVYFARSPGSIWIAFGELPERTREALWEKHKSKLMFPAGLEGIFDDKGSASSGPDDLPF
jgi:hypothetical protein